MIEDVIADVLLTDQMTSNIIESTSLKVNVFRYKQSLDDKTLLFWTPWAMKKGEWPFIYFLKLVEGKVIANTDLGSSI